MMDSTKPEKRPFASVEQLRHFLATWPIPVTAASVTSFRDEVAAELNLNVSHTDLIRAVIYLGFAVVPVGRYGYRFIKSQDVQAIEPAPQVTQPTKKIALASLFQ